jgi:ribosomal protein S8
MSIININRLHKKLIFKILYSRKKFFIIKLLKYINIIYKYSLIKSKNKNWTFIQIHLNFFKAKKIGNYFKVISKPSKKIFISHKSLRFLTKRTGQSIFLISTTIGIVIHQKAIKEKISGIVLGFIII